MLGRLVLAVAALALLTSGARPRERAHTHVTVLSSALAGGGFGPPTSYLTTTAGSDFVEIPSADVAAVIDSQTELVLAFWMRKSTVSSNKIVISRAGASTQFILRTSTDRFTNNWSSTSRGSVYTYAAISFTPTDGLWHYYVSWYRSGQDERFYIDGVRQIGAASGSKPFALGALSENLQVGPNAMDIAQLSIYSAPGFTEQQVIDLYGDGAPAPDYYNALDSLAGLIVSGSPTVN